MKRLLNPVILVAILAVLILGIYAFTFQVSFHEVAVKVRLGEPQGVIEKPGLKFRWPLIESVKHYDTRLQTLDVPEAEIKTADGKNVIIGTYAIWRIEDPLQFYIRAREVSTAAEYMRSRISQAQSAIVGQMSLSDFVNLDTEYVDSQYDQMLQEMLTKTEERDDGQAEVGIQTSLARDFGVRVEQVGVRRISLPSEVTQEVFNSMIQDRRALAARYREEGKAQAQAIEDRAESDAKSIMAFASTKAKEMSAAGQQASERYLREIDKLDPSYFAWLRYIEALEAMFARNTTVFIDSSWGDFVKTFAEPPVPPEPRQSAQED